MSSDRRQFLLQSSALLATLFSPPAMSREALRDLSAAAAVAEMRAGELKAEDYANALLDRAARLTELNAFLTIRPEEVRAAARKADKNRAAGKPLGLLHGLPVPVKDSINTKDAPTTNGTRALR